LGFGCGKDHIIIIIIDININFQQIPNYETKLIDVELG
jgi:hypothetical protein